MKGLVKLNVQSETINSFAQGVFSKTPLKYGVTLHFGEGLEDWLDLDGEIHPVWVGPYFKGEETDSLRVLVDFPTPNTPHITLSWADHSAPVVSGKELNAALPYLTPLTKEHCKKVLGTIEVVVFN